MAINPSTLAKNLGRITAPDANYPYGSAKDDTTGTTGDGTPVTKEMLNDIYGFFQKVLTRAAIVPSGNAETALDSQIGDALNTYYLKREDLATDADMVAGIEDDKWVSTAKVQNVFKKHGFGIVIGSDSGLPHPIPGEQLNEKTDADTILNTGLYHMPRDWVPYPFQSFGGALMHLQSESPDRAVQQFKEVWQDLSGAFYMRRKEAGIWSEWYRVTRGVGGGRVSSNAHRWNLVLSGGAPLPAGNGRQNNSRLKYFVQISGVVNQSNQTGFVFASPEGEPAIHMYSAAFSSRTTISYIVPYVTYDYRAAGFPHTPLTVTDAYVEETE